MLHIRDTYLRTCTHTCLQVRARGTTGKIGHGWTETSQRHLVWAGVGRHAQGMYACLYVCMCIILQDMHVCLHSQHHVPQIFVKPRCTHTHDTLHVDRATICAWTDPRPKSSNAYACTCANKERSSQHDGVQYSFHFWRSGSRQRHECNDLQYARIQQDIPRRAYGVSRAIWGYVFLISDRHLLVSGIQRHSICNIDGRRAGFHLWALRCLSHETYEARYTQAILAWVEGAAGIGMAASSQAKKEERRQISHKGLLRFYDGGLWSNIRSK